MTFGVDYAFGRPSMAALHDAGVSFVCRYLSGGGTKDLTRAEADELSAAGISIVCVWETTATRGEAGRSAGVSDARAALSEAMACGMPPGRPVYFAVDEDTTVGPNLTAYFEGAASVLGVARTGVYGGYEVVKGCFDAGLVRWGWNTYAWSAGRWDSRAQLQQYSNDHTLDGVSVDYDRALTGDFGQWRVGAAGPPASGGGGTTDWMDAIMQALPNVKNGDVNNHVRTAQALCNARAAGAAEPQIGVDGHFGASTVARVRQVQTAAKLTVDGIVGPKTWTALLSGQDL